MPLNLPAPLDVSITILSPEALLSISPLKVALPLGVQDIF